MNRREKDIGLQPERTTLSWLRTVFVVLITALLVIRVGYSNKNGYVFFAGIELLFFTASIYVLSLFRMKKFVFDTELTTKNAVWVKRYVAFMVFLSALLIAFSCVTNIYNVANGRFQPKIDYPVHRLWLIHVDDVHYRVNANNRNDNKASNGRGTLRH